MYITGTDKESFGFGGTGKKSFGRKFDTYGEVRERSLFMPQVGTEEKGKKM